MGRVEWCQSSVVVLYVESGLKAKPPSPRLPSRPFPRLQFSEASPSGMRSDGGVRRPGRDTVNASGPAVASPQTSSEGAADVSCSPQSHDNRARSLIPYPSARSSRGIS